MAAVPDKARQAFRLLYVGFVVAPILAGLDKFFDVLVDWDKYLAPVVTDVLPVSAHTLMMAVGVVEIAAGVLVALRPRIGGYVVAVWLWAIIVNLLVAGDYFDIALRDFGLSLGALAPAGSVTVVADRHLRVDDERMRRPSSLLEGARDRPRTARRAPRARARHLR
jgi:hypothetical protein